MSNHPPRHWPPVAALGEPPCEKFQCAQRETCKADGLACFAFGVYVRSGKRLDPCTQPAPTHRPQHAASRRILSEAPEPTRERFLRIFSTDDFGRGDA